MQKMIVVFFFCFINFCFGQGKLLDILPLKDDKITYTEVVNIENLNKDQLYIKAKKWFVKNYKSANNVIQLEDKEIGEILGKGNFQIAYYTRAPRIGHTVSIKVKDGRFKYTITNLQYSDKKGDNFIMEKFPKSWGGKKKLYLKVDAKIQAIISDLKNSFKIDKDDDW